MQITCVYSRWCCLKRLFSESSVPSMSGPQPHGGVVAAVRSGELVVSEWAIRADGTRDRTQTVLRLPKEAALNLEE